MMPDPLKKQEESKSIYWRDGKLYFSRRTERGFYFMLTVIILLWGALVKFGILS